MRTTLFAEQLFSYLYSHEIVFKRLYDNSCYIKNKIEFLKVYLEKDFYMLFSIKHIDNKKKIELLEVPLFVDGFLTKLQIEANTRKKLEQAQPVNNDMFDTFNILSKCINNKQFFNLFMKIFKMLFDIMDKYLSLINIPASNKDEEILNCNIYNYFISLITSIEQQSDVTWDLFNLYAIKKKIVKVVNFIKTNIHLYTYLTYYPDVNKVIKEKLLLIAPLFDNLLDNKQDKNIFKQLYTLVIL